MEIEKQYPKYAVVRGKRYGSPQTSHLLSRDDFRNDDFVIRPRGLHTATTMGVTYYW